MPDTDLPVSKKTAIRKRVTPRISSMTTATPSFIDKSLTPIIQTFSELITKISESKTEFEKLQKEISEVRELWTKDQKEYELKLVERNQQKEIARQREEETYKYETALTRKKAEDEFAEKKSKWEKELVDRKEEIENDKKELEMLRKQVAGFETEKEKAVKEAVSTLQRQLTDKFETDKKLREQEVRAEKEVLNLNISHLTAENTRLSDEIATMKKALEEATKQVKDIAVKVIESSNTGVKSSSGSEG